MTKILIVKPSSLGDIVHGLVVAQAIKDQLPDCHITWIARERFVPIVKSCPTVDRTLVFQRKGGIGAFFRLLGQIRVEKYDYSLDFQGLARSCLMTCLARANVSIGRTDSREFARWFYGKRAPMPAAGTQSHIIDKLLHFLPLMGLEPRIGRPIVLKSDPGSLSGLMAKKPLVMAPNSREPSREWKGFVELTRWVVKNHPSVPVVWDSHIQWRTPEDLINVPQFYNLTRQTTIPQMIALIQAARLAVVNDSGPMHIAAAVGTPLVACFGPTLPECSGPYPLSRPTHRIARAPDGDLARLEVGAVYGEVDALLRTT